MDSCHIFNFLFGTRKATTELSKCFTSTINEVTKRKKTNTPTPGDNNRVNRSSLAPYKDDPQIKKSIISMSNQDGGTTTKTIEVNEATSSPPSPLKQVQTKLATLVSSPITKQQFHIVNDPIQNEPNVRRESYQEFHSGTYRATLVESTSSATMDMFDEEEDDQENDGDAYNGAFGGVNQSILDDNDYYDILDVSTVRIVENPATDMMEKQSHIDNNLISKVETNWPANQDKRSAILYVEQEQTAVEASSADNLICKQQLGILSRDSSVSSAEVSELHSPLSGNDGPSYRRLVNQTELSEGSGDEGATRKQAPKFCDLFHHQDDDDDKSSSSKRVKNLVQSFEINTSQQTHQTRKLSSDSSSTASTSIDGSSQVSSPRRKCMNWPPPQLQPPNSDNNNNNTTNQARDNPTSMAKITTAIVKPLQQQTKLHHHHHHHYQQQPPKTPVKTKRAKCLNHQLSLNKPLKIDQLFQDERFLPHLFDQLEPLDRCTAAQVCRSWRNILYSRQSYWKDLVSVIDCTQLRREHLVECIMNTLHQSAKLKQQQQQKDIIHNNNNHPQNHHHHHHHHHNQHHYGHQRNGQHHSATSINFNINHYDNTILAINNHLNNQNHNQVDQDEVWRIQELCNKFNGNKSNWSFTSQQQFTRSILNNNHYDHSSVHGPLDTNSNNNSTTANMAHSKSSSIPSQISSTLSSVSISSLLSPLSESSRVDSIKEKLYSSLDDRGFDAISLFGATDEDIEDLVSKSPTGAHRRILVGRMNNCCFTDRGLDLFITTFNQIEELELSGCNEITNAIDLRILPNLRRLIITDCINMADGLAQRLIQIFHQLTELTIQAYHMTDAFLEYISLNSDTFNLRRLELPNCKEITNQSMLTIAKYFEQVEVLSISGSTKITDDGIELLTERAKRLKSLDLSWCTKITDASLECIACDLTSSLTELILDRNVHITDIGIGYLATMTKLRLLHIRWCSRVTDVGLESLLTLRTLRCLSLAGLHQLTARSLLCLTEAEQLVELELTNCPAVNAELLGFLSSRLPKCNIIF